MSFDEVFWFVVEDYESSPAFESKKWSDDKKNVLHFFILYERQLENGFFFFKWSFFENENGRRGWDWGMIELTELGGMKANVLTWRRGKVVGGAAKVEMDSNGSQRCSSSLDRLHCAPFFLVIL